ncbi:MAG: DUF881 domain-containing protein, partial [Peptoniphilus sp.]|nr:DUF881 domain-containing protein [Peptoniphilus sp.]
YQNEIKQGQLETGMMAVKGPGIVVTMYDLHRTRPEGYDYNWDVIHDSDILNIINDLNYAGAEAISINEERFISSTGIMCGGPIIIVNDERMGTPFQIKAIGDKDRLTAQLTAPNTYGSILLEEGFQFVVEQRDEIIIPAFKGDRTLKYAKPLEETK